MRIEEKDFILETSNDSGLFWDLSLPKVVNKGKENERTEWDKPKYGLQLETALKYIAHYKAVNKLGDFSTLKDYIREYKNAVKELEDIIK